MELGDLRHVLKIINAHDDDDGEAAERDYEQNGFDHQFVLEDEGQVIGVTGYRPIEGCDRSFWLSWTYLNAAKQRQGYGRQMLRFVIAKLDELQGRKLFVKVSDYIDSEKGPIYASALALYESLGFQLEVENSDFYAEGESQLILGLVLDGESDETFIIAEENPSIKFNALFEIAETEGSYSFGWTVAKKKPLFGKKFFTVDDLNIGIQSTSESGGRAIFITFPSNIPQINEPLQKAGFEKIGQLADYYEKGVHELHFVYRLG